MAEYTFTSDLDIITEALLDEAAGLGMSGIPEDDRLAETLKAVAVRISRKREDMA